ncbi:putative RNA-directed DNA polymerase, partial [Aphis craccivora]
KNRSSQSIPSCVSLHGKQSISFPDTANLFAAYFSSVFTQPSLTPSQTLHPICLFPLPSNAYFSISDVYKCLCSLRNVKSVGPDGVQLSRVFFRLHLNLALLDTIFYTDFSKAFDRVDQNHLMIQWVIVNSTSSDRFTLFSGVPKGAVLSPLLFALFINSANSVLQHAKLLIFADDMKIFFRIKSISDCHLLQYDLHRINAVVVHIYTVNNTALTTCNNYVKDLGFTLTRNLCPNMHIQIICCKVLKLLGFINRVSSDFHLLSLLKTLFCFLVRPILEYGSVLWDPSTASIQSLTDRRHSANLTFLFNLLSSKIDSPESLSRVSFNVPSRLTRSSVPFHIPFSSSNYFLNSPIIRFMRIANTDPSFSL